MMLIPCQLSSHRRFCPSNANAATISPAVLRITSIIRVIITEQSLLALLAREPTTGRRHTWQADALPIACLPTILWPSGVIQTYESLIARLWVLYVSSTCRIDVGELASAHARVEVGAVWIVWDTRHVVGTGSDLQAAGAAEIRGLHQPKACKADGRKGEEAVDEHCCGDVDAQVEWLL